MSLAAAAAMTTVAVEEVQLPLAHLPSVGTWLLPLPQQQLLRAGREASDDFVTVPEDNTVDHPEVEDADDATRAAEQFPMSARMQRKVTGAVASVVGVAQFGAGKFCEKWQATDDAATRALFASEEYLSKKADVISEARASVTTAASEKTDRVQKAVSERARQGYAFAVDRTRPVRQAAGYAKEKLEAVSDAIHDKTAAGIHAGGKTAEKVSDKFTNGCGFVAGKAEDISASMAAKANQGMSFFSAKSAVVKQSSKVASWTSRASGA